MAVNASQITSNLYVVVNLYGLSKEKDQISALLIHCNGNRPCQWHAAHNLGPCSVTEWFQALTFEKDVLWIVTKPVITQSTHPHTKATLDATRLNPHYDCYCPQYLPLKSGARSGNSSPYAHGNTFHAVLDIKYTCPSTWLTTWGIFVYFITNILLFYPIQHLFYWTNLFSAGFWWFICFVYSVLSNNSAHVPSGWQKVLIINIIFIIAI